MVVVKNMCSIFVELSVLWSPDSNEGVFTKYISVRIVFMIVFAALDIKRIERIMHQTNLIGFSMDA